MDKDAFNKYLDDLLEQGKAEAHMSDFTRAVNDIISETEFDNSKQAFLFISIDNADRPQADSFMSYYGDGNGCALLLRAMKVMVDKLGKGTNND